MTTSNQEHKKILLKYYFKSLTVNTIGNFIPKGNHFFCYYKLHQLPNKSTFKFHSCAVTTAKRKQLWLKIEIKAMAVCIWGATIYTGVE